MAESPYNDHAFENLTESFLKDYWRFHPHEATFAGIHDYDNQLDHVDLNTRNEFLKKKIGLVEQLISFKSGGELSRDNLLDLEVLKSVLENDIVSDKLFNRLERDPSIYISLSIFACHILLLRNFAPKEERYASLIGRLNDIPRFLEEAKSNLLLADSIPPIWLEIAKDMAFSSQHFFSTIESEISKEIESLKNEMIEAGQEASQAYEDYLTFLEKELSLKPKGEYAAGKEYFEHLLKEYHRLPYSIHEIEDIGWNYIEDTINAITQLAEQIAPDKDWMEVIDMVKSNTPSADKLLEFYREEISRTHQFVIDNDLVSMPSAESLKVIETPPIHRSTYPYAAYMMPGPFEKDQRGYFWVTPVDEKAAPEREKEQLSGHSIPAIAVRTLHEGYPGHHLQLCVANRIKSKIRRLFSTSVFCEGWALYCEKLMKQKGYYPDKETELIQLKDQLWRACRVVIDVRLHTGRISFDEAVEMLVEKARLEKSSAVAEVKRYSQSPTQPISYLIGKIEIERLIRDLEEKFPNASQKEIHDKLLSLGTIPVKLVRDYLLGTK